MKVHHILLTCLLLTSNFCTFQDREKAQQSIFVSDTLSQALYPYLTLDHTNRPIVCWVEKNEDGKSQLFFSGESKNFQEKIRIPTPGNLKTHSESNPKIIFNKKGEILAAYQVSFATEENRFAGAIEYVQSFDGGKTWTQARFLHSGSSKEESRGYFDLALLADDEIGAVWLDHQNEETKGRPLMFAKTKGRNGFQEEKTIESDACECCRTDIETNSRGEVAIVFRDLLEDSARDMSFIYSHDNGVTFSSSRVISPDGWKVKACPHTGPAIGLSGEKIWFNWYSGKKEEDGVYFNFFNKTDQQFSKKEKLSSNRNAARPQLTVLPDSRPIAVWEEPYEKENEIFKRIFLKEMANNNASIIAVNADNTRGSFPVIVSIPGSIWVSWQQQFQNTSAVMIKRIVLNEN